MNPGMERKRTERQLIERALAYAMAAERYTIECDRLHAGSPGFTEAFEKDLLAQSACSGMNDAETRLLALAKDLLEIAKKEQAEEDATAKAKKDEGDAPF